ncbi:hypothetical protein FAZ19_07195 [Sphingobacterium alkalisoli]|uniref:Uncharacterized protein n=1 Tax=Sphingobacterium alkalisoli TaxID=1874115 RepID=A0A4U0H4P8_9SPHI|nr:hypothetical protein [Sphingobacterium alkalisoli]TJY66697.1 hypothetical protein FAZ19_07195 [Sphingobacterium alkalisoli]GGH14760.1 hypothetical protein GCM10011418_15930 [Sphingobacterium alkalisoli]
MNKIKIFLRKTLRFLSYNYASFAFAMAYGGIITIYTLDVINFTALAGALASIATLYFGSLKIKIENDILFKELFKSFNDRYDTRFNDLINCLKADESISLTMEQRNLIIDYFNLCAEEYLWKTKKRIPTDVWRAWRAGIEENLKVTQIKDLYESEVATPLGRMSYYGLYEELKRN